MHPSSFTPCMVAEHCCSPHVPCHRQALRDQGSKGREPQITWTHWKISRWNPHLMFQGKQCTAWNLWEQNCMARIHQKHSMRRRVNKKKCTQTSFRFGEIKRVLVEKKKKVFSPRTAPFQDAGTHAHNVYRAIQNQHMPLLFPWSVNSIRKETPFNLALCLISVPSDS